MIHEIRRDEALRSWPLWIGIFGFLALNSTPSLDRSGAVAHEFWVICWFPPAAYLLFAHLWPRASVLDLCLPLPARRLWLAHSLALGLGAMALLALPVSLGVLVGQIGDVPLAAALFLDGVLRLGAGLVIAVVVLQSRQPAHTRLTPSLAESLFLAAVLFGVPIVLVLDGEWVIVLLGLALGLGFHTWRSLPPVLTLEQVAHVEPMVDTTKPWLGQRTLHERRLLVAGRWDALDSHRHSVSGIVYAVVFLGILFFLGILLSEPIEADSSSAKYRSLWELLVLGLSTLWAHGTLRQLEMLDPLPVSRRVLFAAMTLRPMGMVVLGFGFGAVFKRSLDETSAIFVLLLGALWLGLVALFLGALHALRVQGALLLATIFSASLFNGAVKRGWIGLSALPDIAEALALPGGKAVLVLLAVLLLGATYALAEAWFRRFEVPASLGESEFLRIMDGGDHE